MSDGLTWWQLEAIKGCERYATAQAIAGRKASAPIKLSGKARQVYITDQRAAGKTYVEIAADIGVSANRAAQIERQVYRRD